MLNDDDEKLLKVFDKDGNSILELPINTLYPEFWLSDMDSDDDIEIIFGKNETIGILDIPNAGSSIGWPGQQGNHRNTGVLLQPAYIVSEDTTYWYNTILLTDSLTIGSHSTLIIKPGTIIRADAESQLAVYGKLIAEGTANHPIIFVSDTMNAENDYWQGITLCNNSSSSFKYVEISNAEFGLLFEDFSSQTTENCTFENNTVGIGAFSSSPVIMECYFTGNEKGIAAYSGGSPLLTDLVYEEQFKNAIINNDVGIYLNNSSVYTSGGYNDIYNSPASGYYLQSTVEGEIEATYNYWGSTEVKEIRKYLSPSASIDIEPLCTSSNTSYKSTSGIENDLLKEAYGEIAEGDNSAAESIFKNIITSYPLSNSAYLAVSGLYSCYSYTGENWQNLETYFENLYNDTTNVLDKKLVYGYLNLSKRALGNYSDAIANYENILLNNPTYNDSVFAVINIGNTYHEAGIYKSSLGSLTYLRPESDAAHIENTIDMLLSLKVENGGQEHYYNNEFIIHKIYPNPFSNYTTLSYYTSSDCNISFNIYDGLGRVVSKSHLGRVNCGKHQIILELSQEDTGTYFIGMMVDGILADLEKIVLK